jgi:MYXO-CTERM domain-containing protein
VDNTAPTVDSTVPADNAVDVTVNTLVTATFSEAIDNTTVDGDSFFVSDGVDNVVGTVSISADNTTVTFTSSAFLADNTVYTATLTTDITDLAGNPIESDYTWSFTTGTFTDTTSPTVLSTAPDNNATAVALTATVSAVFDEGIDPATVDNTSFFVTDGMDNVVEGTITISDNTATFTPSADLAADAVYTATLTTAVTDLAGNPLADNVVWSFTTAVPPPPSDDGGGCSVTGAGSRWDNGAAIALLGLLAMFIALRFRKRKDRK